MAHSIEVRPFAAADAPALFGLMAQLGYRVPERETAVRIADIRKAGGEVFVAADARGDVLGCVQAMLDVRLAEGRFGEMVSLVVDENGRGQGLGRLLAAAVQDWAARRGAFRLRVRCNVARRETRAFYERLGFKKLKEQSVWELSLEQDGRLGSLT
jgi:GNAT superfamily N-acetyltransferase